MSFSRAASRAAEPQVEREAPGARPAGQVLALQQSAGNAAVAGLLSRAPAGSVALPKPPPETTRHDAAITDGLAQAAQARGGVPEAPDGAAPAARAPELARAIVDAAVRTLDPGGRVAELQPLAERLVAPEQQALTGVLQASPTGDGLAAHLKRRVPALAGALRESAIKELEWEPLNALGRAHSPDFDAAVEAREVRASVKGWGTDEKRLFKALTDRTPLQVAAMRKAYTAVFERDMDEDIDDDLSGSERDRADALRSGDPTAGAVATLRDAMDGAGTDEQLIFQTLRGKAPAERAAIVSAYKAKYGVDLQADLADEMGGYELGQATALLAGDTTKADAMALKDAMDGAGTDEAGINAVYGRIRDEVEAQAAAKGWKTAEVEAEVKRRTRELEQTYDTAFDADLAQDFEGELSGGELDFALAEQAGDQTAMDAATLRTEHLSAWTSDDKVNEVLKSQYLRAKREVMRDLAVDFQAQAAHMPPQERAAAWKALQQRGEALAVERSQQYMAGLRAGYDRTGNFDALIQYEVSGYSRDEAKERIASGGHLSDAKELKYAIFGLGTNEQAIRETLKGKSKGELDQLAQAYEVETGNDLVGDLKGDLSGRDEADMTRLMQTGDATPEERLAYLKARKEWELTEGTGVRGRADTVEEARVLEATTKEAEAAYAHFAANMNDPAARERMERWLGYGEKDIDRHREELDSAADRIALVSAIAVGLAVTLITAGTAGPAVAAALGALASTAASMSVKQDMKGAAYGGEDMAIDVVQGLADAIVQTATAGVGKAALEALAGTEAFAIVGRAAKGGTFAKFAVKAGESGFEGLVQGVPSGVVSAVLDDGTWHSEDPIGAIIRAGGRAAAHAATMGAGIGAAGEGAAHALGGGHAPGGGGGGGHESGGGGGHEPTGVHELPEGSVIHNLSHADTEVAYENAIADTPQREAAIWEHFESGERIVVQGRNETTEMADDVEPEFGDQNYGGRKHFHTIDAQTGLTPEESLYPSPGADGDMERARGDARRARRPWHAEIEVVTPDGRLSVRYGFDPGAELPYWVHPPESLGGGPEPERFAGLHDYIDWVERQHAIRRGETPPEAPPPPPRPPAPPPAPERVPPTREDPEVDDFFAEQRERLTAPRDPEIADYDVPDDGAGSFTDLPTGEFTDEPTVQDLRVDEDDDPARDFDDEPTQ